MSPIQTLLDAAETVALASQALPRWEFETSHVSSRLGAMAPKAVTRAIRDLAIVDIESSGAMGQLAAVREALTRQHGGDGDVVAARTGLLARQGDLAERLLRVRRAMRDLDTAIGGAIRDLEEQGVDSRILRICGDGAERTLEEVGRALAADHEDIGDARAAWRTSRTGGPVLITVGTTSRVEMRDALDRLASTGHVRRTGIVNPRWAVVQPLDKAA